MDLLIRPKFLLLLLEQGERFIEDHIRLFLLLANATSYPDDALCAFCDGSMNTTLLSAVVRRWSSRGFCHLCVLDSGEKWIAWLISPDPLLTQSPAHHLPTVRSISPSPPMTENHFLPQSACQRKAERLRRGSSRKLSPTIRPGA